MKSIPNINDDIFKIIQSIATDLRDPNGGCPWDLKQTHQSVSKYIIEEAYEAVQAIDQLQEDKPETIQNLKEELGDLLFQIVFHAQLAKEKSFFTLEDVVRYISEKLIFRHPHVYGALADAELSVSDVLQNWEILKIKEKEKKGKDETILSGIPMQLPALLKSYRIGQKVSRLHFDWESAERAKTKVMEEWSELEVELYNRSTIGLHRVEDEFGDLLFSLAQYARHLNIDPEKCLQNTNQKFMNRFHHMEKKVSNQISQNIFPSVEEWEKMWQEAKKDIP